MKHEYEKMKEQELYSSHPVYIYRYTFRAWSEEAQETFRAYTGGEEITGTVRVCYRDDQESAAQREAFARELALAAGHRRVPAIGGPNVAGITRTEHRTNINRIFRGKSLHYQTKSFRIGDEYELELTEEAYQALSWSDIAKV